MSENNKFYEIDADIETNVLVVREKGQRYAVDLNERLLQFAVDVIKFLMTLPYKKEFEVFRYQLSKSSTAIGANYEESQAASYAEFRQRIQICLREARESLYFLKVIHRLKIKDDNNYVNELNRILQEAKEIKLIFGAISAKTRKQG